MKPIHINAKTISDAWFQLIYELAPDKNEHQIYYKQSIQRGSFENEQHRRQFAGASIYIELPDQDIVPYIPPAYGIPAPTTIEYIEDYFATYLMSDELQENETYTYGARINSLMPETPSDYHGIIKRYIDAGKDVEGDHLEKSWELMRLSGNKGGTQLERIVDMLKKTPLTNHAVIEIATPWDLDLCWGKDEKNDPPCLRLIDFKVIPVPTCNCHTYEPGKAACSDCDERELTLSVSVYFRSWDLWAGLPSNLGGIELMKQYVADACGLKNGTMYAYSAGLHIYGYQEEMAAIRTGRS